MRLSFLDKLEERVNSIEPGLNILCTIPDNITLNRQVFMSYLRKYNKPPNKARKFGFSRKHTKDIEAIKAKYGSSGSQNEIYGLPVQWNTDHTFLAS